MTLFSAVAAVEGGTADRYLAEQSDLTAVERFAQRHETELVPRQARYYRDLLPLERPLPGQQYAFEVDLDACTGCKACVSACHSLNGLDDGESWRSVTLLSGGTLGRAVQQTVTSACHHCVDPACLAGCPVDAYEKDPVTGIVAHLDDQCIGCGYCTLTCPYEVPVFNKARGIVRKCDMCQDRLSAGEAPACVQACPNEAIAITIVDVRAATARARAGVVVPAGPPASITLPTSVYRTANIEVEALGASGRIQVGPARAHTPLAVMLVLTQLAVGAFATDLVVRLAGGSGAPRSFDAIVALAAGLIALAASVGHLGRPRYCYRAVIGWRHSWLSREVLAFGAFTGSAGLYALLVASSRPLGRGLEAALAGFALAAGLIGVICSVLIYATTHRSSWRPVTVSMRFALTATVCGLSAVVWATLVSSVISGQLVPVARLLEIVTASVTAVKLGIEAAAFLPATDDRARRARLMTGDLRVITTVRFAAGGIGGLLIPALLALVSLGPSWAAVALATAGLAGLSAGELAERSLFFTTASRPR